jgi:hypothetical protein
VKDFEVAVRYLETRSKAERLSCFRQLCRSAWPTIRHFAMDAATNGAHGIIAKQKAEDEDWSPESRLMVEYVKTAGPLLTDWERADLTSKLRSSLYHPAFGPSCWRSRCARRRCASSDPIVSKGNLRARNRA